MAKKTVKVVYCNHCKTSTCEDPAVGFDHLHGEIIETVTSYRATGWKAKDALAGKLEMLLAADITLRLQTIKTCGQCKERIAAVGGLTGPSGPKSRQKRNLLDEDSGGYGSVAKRALESD